MKMTLPLCLCLVAPAMGEEPPPPSARPVKTTLEDVWLKKHPAGAAVEFEAVLLPTTAIQTKAGTKTSHFMLAAHRDSPFFDEVARVAAALETEVESRPRELTAALDNDSAWDRAITGYQNRMKSVERASKIAASESVAVELLGFDRLAGTYEWKTIIDRGSLRFSSIPPSPPVQPGRQPISPAEVRAQVRELAAQRPPDLGRPMPGLRAPWFSAPQAEREEFEAIAKEYNAEIERRRRFTVQQAHADLLEALGRLRRMLAGADHAIRATVVRPPALAVETLEKVYRETPPVFLREISGSRGTVAKRYFQTAGLLVVSEPAGARVLLDGQEVGKTPHLASDLAVGMSFQVGLELDGFVKQERTIPLKASPDGVSRVELILEAQR